MKKILLTLILLTSFTGYVNANTIKVVDKETNVEKISVYEEETIKVETEYKNVYTAYVSDEDIKNSSVVKQEGMQKMVYMSLVKLKEISEIKKYNRAIDYKVKKTDKKYLIVFSRMDNEEIDFINDDLLLVYGRKYFVFSEDDITGDEEASFTFRDIYYNQYDVEPFNRIALEIKGEVLNVDSSRVKIVDGDGNNLPIKIQGRIEMDVQTLYIYFDMKEDTSYTVYMNEGAILFNKGIESKYDKLRFRTLKYEMLNVVDTNIEEREKVNEKTKFEITFDKELTLDLITKKQFKVKNLKDPLEGYAVIDNINIEGNKATFNINNYKPNTDYAIELPRGMFKALNAASDKITIEFKTEDEAKVIKTSAIKSGHIADRGVVIKLDNASKIDASKIKLYEGSNIVNAKYFYSAKNGTIYIEGKYLKPEKDYKIVLEKGYAVTESGNANDEDEIAFKTVKEKQLIDVKGHWAEEAAHKARANGFFTHYNVSGYFMPEQPLHKIYMAESLVKALDLEKKYPEEKSTEKVMPEDEYYLYVESAKEALKDEKEDKYTVVGNITREDLIVFIMNKIGDVKLNRRYYNPIDIEDAKEENRNTIRKAYNAGLVNGYEDGSFKPKKFVTNAEFATLIERILKIRG